MVAKGMDTCDSFTCSTSLRSMLYKNNKNAVNTSVLGTVAKGRDACDNVCDNVPCSTSLRSVLYKEAKTL